MTVQSITVRIPGSTSNLGPGFDTLGLAFNVYHRVRIAPCGGRDIRFTSPVDHEHQVSAAAMVAEAAAAFFAASEAEPFGFEIAVEGDVPVARGLGFSALVRLGVVACLSELIGAQWDRQKLLEAVTQLEGHPDNASPAVLGGFTVSGRLSSGVRCLRFPVSDRGHFVTLIPRFGLATKASRQLVPDKFSKADTIHNLNRSALIAAAFASGDLESLRGCFEDRVHQPYREALIPQLSAVIRAGENAGALGGWLSGAGSAIVCLTTQNEERIAAAMQAQLPDSEIRVFQADNEGLTWCNSPNSTSCR